jgi:hypothetical protein
MTVVRELVTKLGFQVDRQGIQQFNRNIIGLKSKLALATGIVGGFVAATLQSIRGVGNLIQDTEILAKKTGIGFEQLIKLTEAAKQFRIKPEQFQGALDSFGKQVRLARQGLGDLNKLALKVGISSRNANGTLKTTEQLFFEIVDVISAIDDEAQRITAFEEIFGEEVGAKFNEFFKNGSQEALELADSMYTLGESMESSIEVSKQFEKDLSTLESTFDNFKKEAVIAITPAVSQSLTGLTEIIKKGREEFGGGITGSLKSFGFVTLDAVKSLFGASELDKLKRSLEEDKAEFDQNLQEYLRERPDVAEKLLKIDNTINIEVPRGTSEEQKAVIKESIEEAVTEQTQEMIRQLQNNNPQVE